MEYPVTINGKKKVVIAEPNENLLDVLRREGYYGVKKGCGTGNCGSCTIIFNGIARKSCVMLAGQMMNAEILTIEGLSSEEQPHPIQTAFVEEAGIQCGYCIPGMILSSHALLERNPDPSDEEIKDALDGNLCRCTGYVKQIKAVKKAAKVLQEEKKK